VDYRISGLKDKVYIKANIKEYIDKRLKSSERNM
jgi:hypothetical protein